MRFDVYGKIELEVVRQDGRWVVYRREEGRRRPFADVVIPDFLPAEEIATHLDDLLHEWAGPGEDVRRID